MVKCEICKNKLEENFLNKPFGTVIKIKGKQNWICNQCQRHKNKEELIKLIN